MKKKNFAGILLRKGRLPGIIVSVFLCLTTCGNQKKNTEVSRTISFDEEWRFIKDNPSGAEKPEFNDSGWRTLDLPHDWSIEDLPNQIEDSISGPFSKSSIGKMGTGYTIGGTGWYRKSFTISKDDKNKLTYLQFDGVYMNSDVWINGKHAGNHPYGYTSFYYDITQYLNQSGQPNVVAVQVKNEGRNARWYSGSGIYRHTWLTIVDPVHIGMWGTFITTPAVSEKSADIEVTTNVISPGKKDIPLSLKLEIIDPSGKVVATSEYKSSGISGSSNDIKLNLTIKNPVLWSTENPELYQARFKLSAENKTVDQLTTSFGIRSIHFDAKNGFTLNGKSTELKGGCFHHDNGPLGSVAIDRAEERKIELLKMAGYNAIRCSHNPPSPYLLDVCDRLGMLVIDEFADMWEKPKISPDDYSKYFKNNWKEDLSSIIRRDRNHPSVIMWSIGNEIPEAADTSGLRIARNLTIEVRSLDPTRPVTEAMVDFALFTTGKSGWDNQAPHMDLLNVVGYNYRYSDYLKDHEKFPDRLIMATEFMPPKSLENWQMSESLPYVIGNFSWTAMDYIGEAGTGTPRLIIEDKNLKHTPGEMGTMGLFFNPESWPTFTNYQGDIDLTGNRKPASYYQNVVWGNSKVEMFVHRPIPAGKKEITSPWGFPDELKSWNWAGQEGKKLQVQVYAHCQTVKLELNGKVIGEQAVDEKKSITTTFEVSYEAGTLIAHCFENGKETASQALKTVGKPASIRLTADRNEIRANRNDLSYVMVELIDTDGNIVPNADDIRVNFEVNGNGKIAGAGNGNPNDMSSFQQPVKKTYQGRCLVIIRPETTPGKIILKATAEGLKEASLIIETR